MEAALKHLDVRQDALIQGDLECRGLTLFRSDATASFRAGVAAGVPNVVECAEQFVDRGRLVLLFGESVACGKRPHFVGADPIDEPIEMFPDARLGPRAVGRFEQHVHRPIELLLRRFDVTLLELLWPALKCRPRWQSVREPDRQSGAGGDRRQWRRCRALRGLHAGGVGVTAGPWIANWSRRPQRRGTARSESAAATEI